MNKLAQDDEVDIFEFFVTLWINKKIIGAFIIFFVFLGSILVQTRETRYESRLSYSAYTLPPSITDMDQKAAFNKLSEDFKGIFFSESFFDNWKQSQKLTKLTFNEINRIEVLDGYTVSKNIQNRLIRFIEEENSYISIGSNNIQTLTEIFNYANYVNKFLSMKYLSRAKKDKKLIEKQSIETQQLDQDGTKELLKIVRYIDQVENNYYVMALDHPSKPKKTSMSTVFVLIISSLLGFVIGFIYVIIRNAIFKYKNLMSKDNK